MGKAVFRVVLGLVMVVGGLSGKLTLRGTNNGVLLAVIGAGLAIYGAYGVLSARRSG